MSRDGRALIDRWLDGIASDDDVVAIESRIASDSNFAREFAAATVEESLIQEHFGQESSGTAFKKLLQERPGGQRAGSSLRISKGREDRSRRAPRVRRVYGTWLSVAACLAIIVGALAYNDYQRRRFPVRLMALVKSTSANVEVSRNGRTIIAVVGMKIMPGDAIRTGARQRISLFYEGENTELDLSPHASIVLERADSGKTNVGKRFRLDAGQVKAVVDAQPAGLPMIVDTPHAEAVVKGTVFSLVVDKSSARLAVTKGVVEFIRKSDGMSIEVGPGYYAAAARGEEFLAQKASNYDLLRELIAKAENAKTYSDLSSLADLAQRAYRHELALESRIHVAKLFWLGVALNITEHVKVDRQAEDLRFVLDMAARAASRDTAIENSLPSEEMRMLIDSYDSARSLLHDRYYDRYHDESRELMQALEKQGGTDAGDAVAFGLVCVWFYERGLPAFAQLLCESGAAEVKAQPGQVYLKRVLIPLLRERIAAERELESTIDLNSIRTENGVWRIADGRVSGIDGAAGKILRQTNPRLRSAIATLSMLSFDEAVFTGQVRFLDVLRKDGKSKIVLGLDGSLPDGRSAVVGYGLSRNSAVPHDERWKRWMWFRLHCIRENGSWILNWEIWGEGVQPYGLTTTSLDDLIEPKYLRPPYPRHPRWPFVTVGGAPFDFRGDPAFALRTEHASAEFRALGVRVIKPKGGGK